jgi:prevent-host-death family protein
MRSVNIAELKNRLSAYVRYARNGEEVVIRDRDLPVAKIVPFDTGNASEHELRLVAEGRMRLPAKPLTKKRLDEILNMPRPSIRGRAATQAILDEREEGW